MCSAKTVYGFFMQEPIEPAVNESPEEEVVIEAPVVDTSDVNEDIVDELASNEAVPVTSPLIIDAEQLQKILESVLLAYSQPLTIEKLQTLFTGDHLLETSSAPAVPEKNEILTALEAIKVSCVDRGFELKKVSSGWRFQVRAEMAPWINKLWEEKPQKYSRALLETLSIIAYRQPITRGDIEEIRGVSVSSHIIKTLSEREWIKVIGHRDVPGRPSLFATTKYFLDYFNLENLEDLPSLRELADIESLTPELDLQPSESASDESAEPIVEAVNILDGAEENDDSLAADNSESSDSISDSAIVNSEEINTEDNESTVSEDHLDEAIVDDLAGVNDDKESVNTDIATDTDIIRS